MLSIHAWPVQIEGRSILLSARTTPLAVMSTPNQVHALGGSGKACVERTPPLTTLVWSSRLGHADELGACVESR